MNTPRPPLATTLPPLQVPPEMAPQVPQTAAAPGPRRRAWLAAALAGALPPAWAQPAALPPHSPATRVALVIGNARYAAGALKNPGNDARLMQATAQALGFRVELLLDATQQQMLTALRTWLAASAEASTRLFYFAGHGAQYRGRNFLIPVDAELQSEDDIPAACIQANDLADRLSRFASGVNLVVLDACRSVPLVAPAPGSRPRSPNGMPPSGGLAELSAPRGTVVAFSTAPGAVASDNPGAANSAYTRHLAAQLRTPGLTIEAVFKRTRAAVLQESRGNQVPWEHSSLVGELCLAPERGAVCGAPAR